MPKPDEADMDDILKKGDMIFFETPDGKYIASYNKKMNRIMIDPEQILLSGLENEEFSALYDGLLEKVGKKHGKGNIFNRRSCFYLGETVNPSDIEEFYKTLIDTLKIDVVIKPKKYSPSNSCALWLDKSKEA